MIEEIHRKYLQIKSLKKLKEVKKPSKNYFIHQTLPKNFQLNKFLYKQIGKKYQWIDRLSWTNQKWINYISQININHLLIDLPSLDKEKDGGELSAHKSFWGFPNKKRHGCTITELIYVPNNILDDIYLLNLQHISNH